MYSLRLVVACYTVVCIVVVVVTAEDDAAQWSYSDYANYGPSQWALVAFDDDTTNTCDGSSQSPIAIAETTHCNAYTDYRVRMLLALCFSLAYNSLLLLLCRPPPLVESINWSTK